LSGLTVKGRRALETLRCDQQEVLQETYERLPSAERTKVVEALELL
jgi:DNA-binding MarR family transcriptional regulator